MHVPGEPEVRRMWIDFDTVVSATEKADTEQTDAEPTDPKNGDKFDPRLNGTWKSNREESVADAFRRDPRWTNANPEKVERFQDMFGHMTLTYSEDVVTTQYQGEEATLRYTVEDRGDDFVVIRLHGGFRDGENMRIRFVEGENGYWITTKTIMGTELHEKFDKVRTGPKKQPRQ